ncbi:hypothetical protein [Planotetraspora sp. GP83]|uniref:hypothetical protein n=1 Tax=Planotetraspora sp. GP83 TaxID=3156264 RepID=UPI00351547A0
MIEVEDGYTVAYDMATVMRHAQTALDADPNAAIELATDGSVLRYSAGPPTLLVAHDVAAPQPQEVAWTRRQPLTFACKPSDVNDMEFLRACLANGSRWLHFMYCPRVTGQWIRTANSWIDQRKPPYDSKDRFMVLSMTHPTHYAVIDLETGMAYREGPGKAGKQADRATMQALCDRLNAEARGD